MKQIITIFTASILLASCGGGTSKDAKAELAKLKTERSALDQKIKAIEAEFSKQNPRKATPVSVLSVQPSVFNSFIDVQSQILGDANVLATAQAPGVVNQVYVKVGQHVS